MRVKRVFRSRVLGKILESKREEVTRDCSFIMKNSVVSAPDQMLFR
jgi:hypothetical protein